VARTGTATSGEVLVRLRKIEGQIRDLQHMVEHGDGCTEVLTQVATACAALAAVGLRLVECDVHRAIAAAADGPFLGTAAAPVIAAVDLLPAR
jgi:DNA-binding FrmR family transcriptional regulator